MTIHSVAVFCGSKNGNNPLFLQHAAELGKQLAILKLQLIYGAGNKGLMGAVADSVLENGGKVTGVIPTLLIEWEQQHNNLTELIVVPDMHTRKKMMYEMSDAAIVLPGGYGTLDEVFEMLTWNQLKIHDKKIYILNSAGFYDWLLQHLHNMEKEGFLYEAVEDRVIFCNSPMGVIEEMWKKM